MPSQTIQDFLMCIICGDGSTLPLQIEKQPYSAENTSSRDCKRCVLALTYVEKRCLLRLSSLDLFPITLHSLWRHGLSGCLEFSISTALLETITTRILPFTLKPIHHFALQIGLAVLFLETLNNLFKGLPKRCTVPEAYLKTSLLYTPWIVSQGTFFYF